MDFSAAGRQALALAVDDGRLIRPKPSSFCAGSGGYRARRQGRGHCTSSPSTHPAFAASITIEIGLRRPVPLVGPANIGAGPKIAADGVLAASPPGCREYRAASRREGTTVRARPDAIIAGIGNSGNLCTAFSMRRTHRLGLAALDIGDHRSAACRTSGHPAPQPFRRTGLPAADNARSGRFSSSTPASRTAVQRPWTGDHAFPS